MTTEHAVTAADPDPRRATSEPVAAEATEVGAPAAAPAAETPGGRGPDERASIGRNMADMVSSQFLSFLLGLVAQITQPRFVGPDGIGQVQLAFSVWMIANIFITFGTGPYLVLEMARDRERGRALVGPVISLRVGLFVVAAAGVALYALIVGYSTEVLILLAITGSTMLVMAVADAFMAAFNGMEQMRYPSVITVASKVVYTAVMVAVLVAGGGVYGLAAVTTFNAGLTLVLLTVYYRRFGRVTWTPPGEGYVGLAKASAGFMAAGAAIVVYLQVDMIIMSLLVDETTLGWYTVADVLMSSLLFLPAIIIAVLFPVIGRLHTDDRDAAADLVRRALSVLTLTGVAIGFGALVVAEPFAILLYGEEFSPAGQVLAVFGVALPFIFTTMLLGTVAQATGHKRYWITLMTVGIVISIGFDIVVVPIMDRVYDNGAIGGALGYVVTEGMMVVVGIRKMAPTAVDRATAWRLVKVIAAGLLMVAAAWPLRDRFLPIPIAVGAAVFVGAVFLFRVLTDDERELLARLGERTPFVRSRVGGA